MNTQLATLRDDHPAENAELERRILQAIQSVRYGQIQIIIQDSRVVQIDKTEKLRLV